MRFVLDIAVDNAAFDEPGEVARILREVAERVDGLVGVFSGGIRDINGNTVGTFDVREG